jgi:hypothetical protein
MPVFYITQALSMSVCLYVCRISIVIYLGKASTYPDYALVTHHHYHSTSFSIKSHAHWQILLAKNFSNSDRRCTCLGHLGCHDADRNISICVESPKVVTASTVVTVVCRCPWCFCLKNFANGNTA